MAASTCTKSELRVNSADFEGATVIGLLKNCPVKFRPVIFALLLYANEVWRHIFQIPKI